MWLTRSLGVNLHPTSLPGGRLGPEAYAFVDWLAAAGARFWQVLPLTPPDDYGSPYASASAFAAWPGLLADPDARVEPSELRRFEAANAYWIGDWVAFAGGGALADQVRFEREWSALRALRRRARRAPDRRRPDLRGGGQLRPRGPPGALPPRRLRRRRAARPAQRHRPEVGQPALRLGGARAARATAGGSSACGARSASSTSSGSTTSAASPATGPCPRRRRPRARATGSPAPAQPSSAPPSSELGALPVIAEDLGVITPDVHALRDDARLPRHGRAALGLRRARRQPAPAREPPRRTRSSTPRRTTPTRSRGHFPDRRAVGAARAGALVARRARDDPRAGRARARLGGADEPARRARRQLGLAARAGPARPRAGRPPARPRREGRARA